MAQSRSFDPRGHFMAVTVEIRAQGAVQLKKELEGVLSTARIRSVVRKVGVFCRERLADHVAEASTARHKTADRLGAMHTGFLEFAPGRGQMRAGSKRRPDGGEGFTEVRNATENGVDVVIGNTPSLVRAFGPVTIRPKRAKALTIPIDKISYARRAGELRREGHSIFRAGRVLAENDGGKLRPLYLLVKKTVLPKDEGLLPTRERFGAWASQAFDDVLFQF